MRSPKQFSIIAAIFFALVATSWISVIAYWVTDSYTVAGLFFGFMLMLGLDIVRKIYE